MEISLESKYILKKDLYIIGTFGHCIVPKGMEFEIESYGVDRGVDGYFKYYQVNFEDKNQGDVQYFFIDNEFDEYVELL